MITNKNQLLIPAPELAKPRLTCTKFCLRCIDMVYERRSEFDNSIINTRVSNLVYVRLFLGGVPEGFHTSTGDFVCYCVGFFVTGFCYRIYAQFQDFCYRIYAPD